MCSIRTLAPVPRRLADSLVAVSIPTLLIAGVLPWHRIRLCTMAGCGEIRTNGWSGSPAWALPLLAGLLVAGVWMLSLPGRGRVPTALAALAASVDVLAAAVIVATLDALVFGRPRFFHFRLAVVEEFPVLSVRPGAGLFLGLLGLLLQAVGAWAAIRRRRARVAPRRPPGPAPDPYADPPTGGHRPGVVPSGAYVDPATGGHRFGAVPPPGPYADPATGGHRPGVVPSGAYVDPATGGHRFGAVPVAPYADPATGAHRSGAVPPSAPYVGAGTGGYPVPSGSSVDPATGSRPVPPGLHPAPGAGARVMPPAGPAAGGPPEPPRSRVDPGAGRQVGSAVPQAGPVVGGLPVPPGSRGEPGAGEGRVPYRGW
jgi:hypothetical protein